MPDPTPTPAPSSSTSSASKRPRAPINQAHLDEISVTEKLAQAVGKTEYAATFAEGGIDAAFLAKLTATLKAANDLISGATGKTATKKKTTGTETELKTALVALLQVVRSRARQKYAAKSKDTLAQYAIDESSRARLESSGHRILDLLDKDTLPGIPAAKVEEIRAALKAYKEIETEQSTGQSEATTGRAQLEALIKQIAAARREIQYAADAQWPARKKTNAGIRREFGLPPDKSLKG